MARHPSGQQPRRGGSPHGYRSRLIRRFFIKRLAALVLAAALLVPTASSTVTAAAAQAAPKGTIVQTYEKLPDFPVDMAWVPGTKTLFYTEKNTGKIRVVRDGALLAEPCRNLRVD